MFRNIIVALVGFVFFWTAGPARALPIYGLGNTDLFGSARFASNLYSIDATTGATSLIGPTGTNLRGLAIDPLTGRAYASGAKRTSTGSGVDGPGGLWEVDLTTGLGSIIGGTRNMSDMVFDASGALYGMESRRTSISRNFYSIDIGTGVETALGMTNLGSSTDLGGFTYSIPDNIFYWSPRNAGTNTPVLRTVDPLTGNSTIIASISPLPTSYFMTRLTASSTGELFGVDRPCCTGIPTSLYTIDKTNGSATLVGSNGVGINSIAYAVATTVPEPTTLSLFGIGLVGLGFALRRRRGKPDPAFSRLLSI